jgi:hypothetical protein
LKKEFPASSQDYDSSRKRPLMKPLTIMFFSTTKSEFSEDIQSPQGRAEQGKRITRQIHFCQRNKKF